jgi:hypothetical protein
MQDTFGDRDRDDDDDDDNGAGEYSIALAYLTSPAVGWLAS